MKCLRERGDTLTKEIHLQESTFPTTGNNIINRQNNFNSTHFPLHTHISLKSKLWTTIFSNEPSRDELPFCQSQWEEILTTLGGNINQLDLILYTIYTNIDFFLSDCFRTL